MKLKTLFSILLFLSQFINFSYAGSIGSSIANFLNPKRNQTSNPTKQKHAELPHEKSDEENLEEILEGSNLLIGAFNIQVYGRSKSRKESVMSVLGDIINRYDILIVQEIRDKSQESIDVLMDAIRESNLNVNMYDKVVSQRLGSTSSKEQYMYIYNTDKLTHEGCVDYVENKPDDFEREPYICTFKLKKNDKQISLVPLHAKPGDIKVVQNGEEVKINVTLKELQNLTDVSEYVKTHINQDNIVILGDLNADCSYLNESERSQIPLYTEGEYQWYIDNDADTTVKSTECAYDRILAKGSLFGDKVTGSRVYNFQEILALTQDFAEDISDHYPVEIEISY